MGPKLLAIAPGVTGISQYFNMRQVELVRFELFFDIAVSEIRLDDDDAASCFIESLHFIG